jgi:hypothetical protein
MPMDVTMPDGTVVTGVPDGTTRAQLLDKLKLKQQKDLGVEGETAKTGTPPPSKFDQSAAGTATRWAEGALDVARSVGSNVASDVVGGLAGIGQVAENAFGLSDQDPVKVIRAWQSHAYPIETKEGQKIVSPVAAVGKQVDKVAKKLGATGEQMGGAVFDVTGSPAAATVAELMPDVLQVITGEKVPAMMKEYATKGAAAIAKDAIMNQTKTAAMRDARQNGLFVSPSEYGGGTGKAITSMSNKAEIERQLSAKNNGRVVDLFKTNFGLPESTKVDRGTFAQIRAKEGLNYQEARTLPRMNIDAPYMADVFNAGSEFDNLTADFKEPELERLEQQIASLRGTYLQPAWTPDSAVNAMNYLRENASDLRRSDNAVDRKLGQVQRQIAEAIEDRLWRHASAEGKPELAAKFQESRKRLAQLHVWEEAVDMDKGYFSARSLVAQRKMMGGKIDPFTDELKIVADAAGAFPKSFQDVSKASMPVSVFERYMLIGGALTAAFGSHEAGAVPLAIAGAGIGGREAMTSEWWQKAMMGPQSGDPGLINQGMQAAGGPVGQGAGAIAGAEAGNE